MKLLDILTEIGDSTQTYNLTGGELKIKDKEQGFYQAIYRFTTKDSEEYKITIDAYDVLDDDDNPEMLKVIDVAFQTKSGGYQATKILPTSDVLKIMATVTSAIKDFTNKNKWVNKIRYNAFDPSKDVGSSQKEKLYASYLTKAFPNSTISRNQSNGDITVQLNQ
jgi:hypothetical protein